MKFGKTFANHRIPEWSTQYVGYKSLKKMIKEITRLQEDIYRNYNRNNYDENGPPTKMRDSANSAQNYLDSPKVQKSLGSFFFAIDRDIEKVDTFYNFQYAEYKKRFERLLLSNQFNEIKLTSEDNVNAEDGVAQTLLAKDTCEIDQLLKGAGQANRTPYHKDDLIEIQSILADLTKQFRNLKWYAELNKRAFIKILKKLDKKVGTNQQRSSLETRILPLQFADDALITKDLSLLKKVWEQVTLKINAYEKLTNNSTLSANVSENVEFFKVISIFIEDDNSKGLIRELTNLYSELSSIPTRIMINVLNKAALSKSLACIDAILNVIPSLNDSEDINKRNFFHHHIIALGKLIGRQDVSDRKRVSQPSKYTSNNGEIITDLNTLHNILAVSVESDVTEEEKKSALTISYILKKLPVHLTPCLFQHDNYKRTPLHYACQYGLSEVTALIIKLMKEWNVWKGFPIDDVSAFGDSESLTPLHLSVLGAHPRATGVLLHSLDPNVKLKSSSLLHLATEWNNYPLLHVLLSSKRFDINYQDNELHETPLYLACRLNFFEAAVCLLYNGADPEIKEKIFGWTAVFVAAAEGFKKIISLLVANCVNFDIEDEGGWTPMEHAVLRGHLDVADMVQIKDELVTHPQSQLNSGSEDKEKSNAITSEKSDDRNENGNGINKGPLGPIKSYGHRFLSKNESLILLTLGSNDTRNRGPSILLDQEALAKVIGLETECALSLVISCSDSIDKFSTIIDLPLDDNVDAVDFKVPFKADYSHTLYFDIVPTYGTHSLESKNNIDCQKDNNNHVMGRGVSMLNKSHSSVGVNRSVLNGNMTTPIIANHTLEVLGTLKFEYIIITPFEHAKLPLERTETYWKSLVATRVIGHRGLGKNNPNKSLQIGENTVESFIMAASLGASYVEFDVQLTKDNVPVVYHDFLVAETGVDIPMHELTLEQFLDLNNANKEHTQRDAGRSTRHVNGVEMALQKNRRRSVDDSNVNTLRRAWDLHNVDPEERSNNANWSNNRMRLTKTFKKNNFKGNARGHSIASSFVTLKELFKKIPANVGFNIECKFPMLDEAEEEELGQIVMEMNHWVDTVLQVVFDNANGRDIIFSSFHPDICVMLSLKQPVIPILFLTEGGSEKMADLRASSLQNGIRFAKKWNLLGIVSAAAPILKAPRLVQVVKSNGLVCVTYGVDNNDPENASIQIEAGVDAVIVDSVLAIRRGLTKKYEK
ncbi:glycerophosphocholine phosphodiesterase [Saccharomyces eubayanus]|uniref:glycerophosphocholine phosphodiesterase n=1 Tax=Saccharomyces eubayanus TaxID=1080349 RepID=UPI0006C55088|nr:GDE1-like protein [Saccharomyces eubayanus]KOG96205.1 GDE1-like protein [Saccharomyces eubayanus]